jgi:hypothetical protein
LAQKIENNTHYQLYLVTNNLQMEVHDSLNNQFKLYNYIAKLNINLLQYLENNNINIDYYCFFSKIIDNIHYIVTSQTTKRRFNGYRLITIQDVEKDNNIFEFNDSLDIIFENINIKVTSIIDDASQISNKLGIIILNFTGQLVNDETIDCFKYYDKNILESKIIKIIKITNVKDLITLNNFENLKELTFGNNYNQAIDVNILPNSLNTLTFGWSYNQIIGVNVLPNSLKALTFGYCYNKTIDVNVLPNSLRALAFNVSYNQIIGVNVLPNSLQTLTFGTQYNQTIGINVLPNSLKTLTFGTQYNQTISINVLPNSLQTLTFGIYYTQVIGINVLPSSLQILTFSGTYKQTISINVLPSSLQVIYFNFGNLLNNTRKCKNYIVPQTFQNMIKYIGTKN